MEIVNAFIGQAEKPTPQEIAAALGSCEKIWNQLVDWLAEEHGVAIQEWKSVSLKYGWSLRLKLKKRTIIYLAPCKECFRVVFILGDRAVKATQESNLPKSVAKAVEDAPRYTEGTGVRLLVRSAKDLPGIRKLVAVKLAN